MPASVADAILWIDVDHMTHSGDGTEITAAEDQVGSHTILASAGGGPTYRATAWGGLPCMEIDAAQALHIASGAVVDLLDGQACASTEFTVIACWQPRHHLNTYIWSWNKSTASSRHLTCRASSNLYLPQTYGDGTGASSTISKPNYWDHNLPKCHIVRRSGGGTPVIQHRVDGVNDSPVTWDWTGNFDVDGFSCGMVNNPSPTYGQDAYVTDLIVFNRALSDAECAQWE